MENKSASPTTGKVIRCKAAVARNPGKPLVIEEIEVDPPKAWEVRIKILCTSLCRSDVTFWKSEPPIAIFPRIFGHEAVGVVESVGEYVEEVKEGDLVLPVCKRQCGECRDCKSTKSNLCSKFGKDYRPNMLRDGTSRFRDLKGEVIHNFIYVSSFTEYTVVDVTHVVKITADIPVDKACLLSCGVSTGVGAAWRVAGVEAGSTVAIFGLGAVGLAVAEGARLRGASKIIGVDLNAEKFDLGKAFGITDFINPTNCGNKTVSQVIKEMTDGGADYCFECIGLASAMEDAFSSSREGWGKTVILGAEMHGSPVSLKSFEILSGRTICGSLFGGMKPKSDIPILAQKYLDKELHLDEFITHEVSFQDINKAFDLLLEGKSLRTIIWMDNDKLN
ncbi:Alcohol dehydrogenase-like [Melia azedarach]|uniref:Alcohol dehydrogenase-like n=1 Tax=Melia azedarach TaxID=155640 RepID=A0ACC1WQI8_MELAZ|nr:Alcohol dehydrogenase-like [Melia azedarach]